MTAALRVGGVVLAAGASSRMGTCKALLVLEGETLVRRASRRAIEGGLSPVVVVVGTDADAGRVREEALAAGAEVAVNADSRTPSSASFQIGVRAMEGRVDAATVLLADMPRVEAQHIAALVDAARRTPAHAAAARYAGTMGPPIVIPRAWFPDLFAWKGEGAGRGLVTRRAADVLFVDLPPSALHDVDTPEDWQAEHD